MTEPTLLDVPRGPLLAPVLGRIVRFHCARAEMDIDRMSDAVLLSDALASRVWDHARDGRVKVAVAVEDGRLVVDVGPLVDGGAEALVDAGVHPDLGSVFATLADVVTARHETDGDHLRLELAPRAGGA